MTTALRARIVLAEARALGVDVADLAAAAGLEPVIPTLARYVQAIEGTFTPATAATYRPYWALAVSMHGERRITDLGIAELQAVVEAAAQRARARRPATDGRSSRETCVAALRGLYRRAFDARVVSVNPAAALTKPRRGRPRRRALDDRELGELLDAVRATSSDPALDLLLIRFHLETGARRSGALALPTADLDDARATVWLTEKGGAREQPVSPSLIGALRSMDARRPRCVAGAALFRRRDGIPITARDYDRLFGGVRAVLPWSSRTPVSAHVLRHTAVTAIARIGGYPVAQAFAGHQPATVTGRYVHASVAEVAAAVAIMTGEAHPLDPGPPHRSSRCLR